MRTDTFRPPILRPTVYLFLMVRFIIRVVTVGLVTMGIGLGVAAAIAVFLANASLFSRSDIFVVGTIGVLNTMGAEALIGAGVGVGVLTGCACPPPPRFRVWFHTRYVGLFPDEFFRLLYGGATVEYVYFTPVAAAVAIGLTTLGTCTGNGG